jgi:hypothetical protein
MNRVERQTTSTFERRFWQTIAVAGSLAVWLAYDAITFVVGCFSVADSGRSIAWYDWEITAGVVALPLAVLAITTVLWFLRRRKVPVTSYGRMMMVAQAVGVGGLATALVYPALALSSYFHWEGELVVHNQTGEIVGVIVDGAKGGGCSDLQVVEPNTSKEVHFQFTSYDCWGDHAAVLEVNHGFHHHQCDWSVAKAHEPLIVTDQDQNC